MLNIMKMKKEKNIQLFRKLQKKFSVEILINASGFDNVFLKC